MSSESPDLRTMQEPLKQRYRDEPESARLTLHATSDLADGDMLLEALAACAGVTMRAVATVAIG